MTVREEVLKAIPEMPEFTTASRLAEQLPFNRSEVRYHAHTQGVETMTDIRKESCLACPYRKDVPSGVWSAGEYDKLAEYDRETPEQPFGAFHCHATPDVICHGWTVVHGRQDHAHEPLAFRLWGIDPSTVEEHTPLFSSGTEAAEHGKRDIENPSEEAMEVVARLQGKYERLR